MRAINSANDPNSDMGMSKYISSTGLWHMLGQV